MADAFRVLSGWGAHTSGIACTLNDMHAIAVVCVDGKVLWLLCVGLLNTADA